MAHHDAEVSPCRPGRTPPGPSAVVVPAGKPWGSLGLLYTSSWGKGSLHPHLAWSSLGLNEPEVRPTSLTSRGNLESTV